MKHYRKHIYPTFAAVLLHQIFWPSDGTALKTGHDSAMDISTWAQQYFQSGYECTACTSGKAPLVLKDIFRV